MRIGDVLGGRAFTDRDIQEMESALGQVFSESVTSVLTTWPLIGKDISLDSADDESELGVDLRWMNPEQILEECSETYPGVSAIRQGFLPIGMCLVGSGDPYFVHVRDGRVVRIPHDAVDDNGELMTSRIEQVSKSIGDFLEACVIASQITP